MSKVVFVGNVPYNMGEDDLIHHFKEVGQVVGFRLVFDRDTGKPKGYGFCEYADHETALSAVRNLNNTDVGGRSLRIDLADSDPFLEGKTTVRGELVDGGGRGASDDMETFLASLPTGTNPPPGRTATDHITQIIGAMNTQRSMEVLAQMKAFVITHPEHARRLLQTHPQLAYALFQSLFVNRITDPTILTRMLEASGGQVPAQAPPPPQQQQPQVYPPPQQQQPLVYSNPNMYATPPPQQQQQQQQYYRPPPPPQQYQQQPIQAPAPTPAPAPMMNLSMPGVSEEQKAMLMQVLSMPQDRINALPEGERAAIQQLRAQFMGVV